jgi:hypothetical protein
MSIITAYTLIMYLFPFILVFWKENEIALLQISNNSVVLVSMRENVYVGNMRTACS